MKEMNNKRTGEIRGTNLTRVLVDASHESVAIRSRVGAIIKILHDHSFATSESTLQDDDNLVRLQELHHRSLRRLKTTQIDRLSDRKADKGNPNSLPV